MKTSKLKKDKMVSARINSQVKAELDKRGITVQMILNDFIDTEFENETRLKRKKK